MDESQVGFELVQVASRDRVRGPQEGVVVRERGEEDSEEKADGCSERKKRLEKMNLNRFGGEGKKRRENTYVLQS